MSLFLAPGHTHRVHRWTEWKAAHATKKFAHQYRDDGILYTIWGYDGPEIHRTSIWKGLVPESAQVTYSQAQNDADRAEFEAYYLNTANTQMAGFSSCEAWVVPARSPAFATARIIYADAPLEVDDDHTTSYTIPNGKTYFLQEVTVGAESHPSEKSLRVDVTYYDGSAEHLIHRVYSSGQTVTIPCGSSTARDGTPVVGNGSTKKIRVKRMVLSGREREMDVVVRGYEV